MSQVEATLTRFAQSPRTSWRSGAGTTRELLRAPSTDLDQPFTWRISVADVASDGPFSTFEGVDRVLMLCEGAGLVVVVNGYAQVLRRFDTVSFPGEAHVTAKLVQGATMDLNVMTARKTTSAAMKVQTVDSPIEVSNGSNGSIVLVALEGTLELHSTDSDPPRALEPYDAIHLTAGATARFGGQGRVARIDIEPHMTTSDGVCGCM